MKTQKTKIKEDKESSKSRYCIIELVL